MYFPFFVKLTIIEHAYRIYEKSLFLEQFIIFIIKGWWRIVHGKLSPTVNNLKSSFPLRKWNGEFFVFFIDFFTSFRT